MFFVKLYYFIMGSKQFLYDIELHRMSFLAHEKIK